MDICANCEDAPKTTFIANSQINKGRYFWYVRHAIWWSRDSSVSV